ncbi:Zn(II)2Cys6 transcription factor [Phanerochaete sordida]|uniref:Zn(II)2Cys6 transcription factor n=1 Tax=Phanerochaete sordida TaxID=48140 RepID=A0A9P3G2P7_9APHY|nr:Zn(II)2Cys6 transcription factor [Phanerochaete sordida]
MSGHPSSSSHIPLATAHGGPSNSATRQRRTNRPRNDLIVVEFRHDQYAQASSSESEEESSRPPRSRKRGHDQAGNKPPGACVHCKSLKVRCQFSPGETRCNRCTAGNHECVARTRKRRKAAPTHDDLRVRARQQDLQIQSLLAKLDQLHIDAKVTKWVEQSQELDKLRGDEVARPPAPETCHYYSSLIGPLDIDLSPNGPSYSKIPMILRTGIVDSREVIDLFNLYFERINPFFTLLDGELHCPQRLIWRSSLLFTVIIACAARHHKRQGLWALAMDIARDSAADALIMGPVDVETVQSLLILAVYPVPKKKWLEDKSWLFMGAAIRMAQEIGLDKPQTGTDIRENINRTRAWINAYCVDGSHATQFGKMPMIKYDDYVIRKYARTWYMSLDNSPYDNTLCGYAELLQDMLRFRRQVGPMSALPDRFREGFDIVSHSIEFDKQFVELISFWRERLEGDPNVKLCPVIRYRCHNFRMIASYLRLVILSVGFQYRLKQGLTRGDYIVEESVKVAKDGIRTVIELLWPSGFLSWAMEANFLYMAFCAGFLLNLLRPKLLPLLDAEHCRDIVKLVKELIAIISSKEVILDGRHSPALYSKFLINLLEKYYTPALRDRIGSAESPPQHSGDEDRSSEAYSWPDRPSHEPTPGPEPDEGQYGSQGVPVVREQDGDAEMDFSLSHFVESALPPPNPAPPQQGYWPMPNTSAGTAGTYPMDPMQWQYPFSYPAIFDMASPPQHLQSY